ncbi:hypothetical protein EMPG_14593, partial [Blastomyces silverae]
MTREVSEQLRVSTDLDSSENQFSAHQSSSTIFNLSILINTLQELKAISLSYEKALKI